MAAQFPRVKRIALASLVVAIAAVGAGMSLVLTADAYTMTVPAQSMKTRADLVRADIVSNHLQPATDYPFPKAFHSASMLPTNSSTATAQLLARGGGVLKVKTIDSTTAVLTNEGKGQLPLPFEALLEGQTIRIIVTLPPMLQMTASWTATELEIEVDSPLNVTFIDLPEIQGITIPIGREQRIERVTVTSDKIVLVTTGGADELGFQLTLDLTK